MTGPNPLQAAKQRILSHFPRFSPILLRLDIQVIPNSREAFITQDWRVGLGDRNLLDVGVGAGTIMHEMFHGLLNHFTRRGDRQPDRWNNATDIVINETLRGLFKYNQQFKTEPDWLFAKTFGLTFGSIPTAEQVYDMLPEGASTLGRKCGSGMGNPHESEASLSSRGDFTWEQTQAAINQTMVELMAPGAGMSGSPEFALWGGAKPREIQVKWGDYLSQLIGMERAAHLGRNRQPDWRRANRRGLSMPGSQTYSPDVSVVVDTSGSMTSDGSIALGQIASVLVELGPVRVLTCDTQITSDRIVGSLSEFMGALGGGGTDLTPALDAARDGITICVTDGWMSKPVVPVSDVIWMLTHKSGKQPWMKKVVVWS